MGIWIRNGGNEKRHRNMERLPWDFYGSIHVTWGPHGPMATTHEIPISFFAAYGDFKMARNITR